MSTSVRRTIGALQLLSFLYSVLFLMHSTASQLQATNPLKLSSPESLGAMLLLFWICIVLASGGRLFREGRPARGLNAAALGLYVAGIGLILHFMPVYHGMLFIRPSGWMLVLALTPLMSVVDIVLPPYRQKSASIA